jgi:hypothetical protein
MERSRPTKAPQILGDIAARDLFPDAVTFLDMEQAIAHSETRLKFWVVACVCSNLVLALPTVFYVGRMAQATEQMSQSVKQLQQSQDLSQDWVRDRMVWEARIEAELKDKGIDATK